MTQATPHAPEPGYWLPEDAYEQIRTARATAETLLDFLDAMNGDRVELTIGGLREMLAGSIIDNLNLNPFETFPCTRPERSARDERVDRGIQAVLGDLFTRPTSRRRDLR